MSFSVSCTVERERERSLPNRQIMRCVSWAIWTIKHISYEKCENDKFKEQLERFVHRREMALLSIKFLFLDIGTPVTKITPIRHTVRFFNSRQNYWRCYINKWMATVYTVDDNIVESDLNQSTKWIQNDCNTKKWAMLLKRKQ